MADKAERWEDNAPGSFYVDKECIVCNLCRDVAPAVFEEAEDGDHDRVYRQPQSAEDLELAREAMSVCPVDAIGDDGAELPSAS